MVGEAFADSAVTHCHARRSSLKTSLTRLSRRPKKPIILPCRQGVPFYLAFRLTGQPPESALASGFRVRTVDVHVIFASLMVVSQLKPPPRCKAFAHAIRCLGFELPSSHARHTRIRLVPLASGRFDPAMQLPHRSIRCRCESTWPSVHLHQIYRWEHCGRCDHGHKNRLSPTMTYVGVT
jgi:hypothetical protein